jgi:fibronectin type 3 domain-containing protein
MERLRKIACALLLAVLVMVASSASASSFQTDYDAIEQTVQSVLMLGLMDENKEFYGNGSGFVAFDSNTLVTNYHVIDGAAEIWAVSDNSKDVYPITRVIAANKEKDIAILEFYIYDDAPILTPLKLSSGGKLRRGEPVVVIGSPQFITNEVTKGDISALYDDNGVPVIQFTAPVSHGSSGGPLFNDRGEVIGITRSTITNNQNTNLAIDISEVIQLFKTREGAGIIRFSWEDSPVRTPMATPKPAAKPTSTPTAKPVSTPAPELETVNDIRVSIDKTGIILQWDPVKHIEQYKVYRSDNESSNFSLIVTVAYSSTFHDKEIKPGNTYYYKIVCENGTAVSQMSKAVKAVVPNATPRPPLAPPSNVNGSAGTEGITITWDAVPYATIYQVYRSVDSGEFVLLEQTLSTRCLDKGAIEPGVYSYKIKSSDGTSLSCDPAEILEISSCYKISESLPAPGNFKALATGTAVTLIWSKVKNAKEYTIYRSTVSAGPYKALAAVTASKYTDKDVKRGCTYYYKIRSMDGTNVSVTSEPIHAVMPEPTPTPKPTKTPKPAVYIPFTPMQKP